MTQTKALRLTDTQKSQFLARCYGWMAFALFLSAVIAYFTALNIFTTDSQTGRIVFTSFGQALYGKGPFNVNGFGLISLCILEIAIVIFLQAKIKTLSVFAASVSFILYAVVNGLTLSSIFMVFEISSIANALLATSVTFIIMCVYGTHTKSDLTKVGRYLVMALMGIILACIVHFVLKMITGAPLAMLDLLISIATVIVFTGLTAWDAQKIIKTAEFAKSSDDYKKVAILGALELYLDFINLLLALLRLFGRRRD